MKFSGINATYSRIIPVLFLSFLLAVVLSFFLPAAVYDRYLDLEIETAHPVRVNVFYDVGDGFKQDLSGGGRLAGEDGVQKLRFMLPGNPVERVRIDFKKSAPEIYIRSGVVVCLDGSLRVVLDMAELQPYRDVELTRDGSDSVRLTASGPEPQSVLPLPRYYLPHRLQVRLLVVLTLMLYPVSWALVGSARCCRRRSEAGCVQQDGGKVIHPLLICSGLIVWLCAGIYFLEQNRSSKSAVLKNEQQSWVEYKDAEDAVHSRVLQLSRADGLTISAQVYRPSGEKGPFPAVLLLHGNYPHGKDYPLYRVLARELARQGYLVMTIDFAGFGKSADPFSGGEPTDVSLETETETALAYLANLPDVQSGKTSIVGHSMGADPALRVGADDENVSAITLIGPPRRVQERYHLPADLGFFWYWAHQVRLKQYGKKTFPSWYDRQTWRQGILERDMVHMLPYLSGIEHKPVLFIDGEREPGTDRTFLGEYVRRCSFPKRYLTLPRANHDCNVMQQGEKLLYDPVTMEQLVGAIDGWHRRSWQAGPALKDMFLNRVGLLFRPAGATGCL